MLHGDALRRPAAAPLAEALALMVAAALIAISVARLPAAGAALVALSLLALWLGAAQAALAALDLWIATALPAAALVATFTVAVASQYGLLGREHRRVRDAFAHYLAPEMVAALAADPEKLRLGGELREITVLFCDLRGFTGIAERLSPEALTRLVNCFLTAIGDVVHAHGGTVSRYTGDGLMAFWNAPLEQADHAARACRAALAMQDAVARLNDELRAEGGAVGELAIGVGINTGPGVVGNFGSATRFDYSAHGDAVNVAARLEAETKTYGVPILVGAATAAQAPEFATRPVDRIALRGRRRPVELHALVGEAPPDSASPPCGRRTQRRAASERGCP
jgi:adenylate cyclase